jgi:CBS domain containing-hemolysin-like protein
MSTILASDPAHADGPPQSGNLPVPVHEGEVLRPAHASWLARAIRTLFGWRSDSLRANLQVVLETSAPDETSFSPVERTMLRNILYLRERRIADIMIPRADIVAVREDISLGELMKLFDTAGHSRLVVYGETLDEPEGMVHIRDLIVYMAANAKVEPKGSARRKKPLPAGLDLRAINLATTLAEAKIIRKLIFVPPSMPAMDLLQQMQATRIHLALVVDEYGGTDGLVSIEDLVEQIVGEIDDEHDSDQPPDIVQQADGSFIADARASLEDVTSTIGEEFNIGEAGEDVDTIGGYLTWLAGRLPLRGEVISGPEPFEIEVLDADPRRIKRVRISRNGPDAVASKGREPRGRTKGSAPPASDAKPAADQHKPDDTADPT